MSQHKAPCRECPWRRASAPGWLGPHTATEWTDWAHGEAKMVCHLAPVCQCVGAAIYRRNSCKLVRFPGALEAQPDHAAVFSHRSQFLEHHTRQPKK